MIEWNVNSPTQGGAGMWDSHIRLGGGTSRPISRVLDALTRAALQLPGPTSRATARRART